MENKQINKQNKTKNNTKFNSISILERGGRGGSGGGRPRGGGSGGGRNNHGKQEQQNKQHHHQHETAAPGTESIAHSYEPPKYDPTYRADYAIPANLKIADLDYLKNLNDKMEQLRIDAEENEEDCAVCFDPILFRAIGRCNHVVRKTERNRAREKRKRRF